MGNTQRMLKGVVSGLLTENAEQGTYARRRKALLERRRSMIFMYATVILVVVGLLLQAGKMVGITSSNKNIRAMKAEMRVMEAHVENLESELMLELRTIVVRQRAKERLGHDQPAVHRASADGYARYAQRRGHARRVRTIKLKEFFGHPERLGTPDAFFLSKTWKHRGKFALVGCRGCAKDGSMV